MQNSCIQKITDEQRPFPCRIHQNAFRYCRSFATAVALRRMATPAYLLAPEVSALLFYMPDQRHQMLFATMWNTGIRIGEARTLTPEII